MYAQEALNLTLPSGAIVDGSYRYLLWRGRGPTTVTWIMLNPSTADALKDDATIRKVKRFSRILTGDDDVRAVVVNLYALRSRSPRALHNPLIDPVGPHNVINVGDALAAAKNVVCAWGAFEGPGHVRRVVEVVAQIENRCIEPLCLGTTALGAPRHPLMLPYSTPFVPYVVATAGGRADA